MLQVIESLDPTILVALIGVLSVVISAGIGAIVSRWHTASKFREELEKLKLERANKQSDSYLENARKQIGTVYVPLSVQLAALKAAFQNYLYQGKTEKGLAAFRARIDRFITELQALELRGAAAYVTTDLEDSLIRFVAFLRASKTSTAPVVDVTYDFRLGAAGFGTRQSGSLRARSSAIARPGRAASISMAGIGMDVRVSDILQAPIGSEDFQARFERDAYRLSVLIREVTLGSTARAVRAMPG